MLLVCFLINKLFQPIMGDRTSQSSKSEPGVVSQQLNPCLAPTRIPYEHHSCTCISTFHTAPWILMRSAAATVATWGMNQQMEIDGSYLSLYLLLSVNLFPIKINEYIFKNILSQFYRSKYCIYNTHSYILIQIVINFDK